MSSRRPILASLLLTLLILASHNATATITTNVGHVIHIVVDGLRSDFMAGNPAFDYLLETGACTLNARPDDLSSQTLPNHIGMFVGRPISDHGYEEDRDHNGTIVDESGLPFESIFDLVEESSASSSASTGMFTSKDKFALFDRSFPITSYFEHKKSKAVIRRFVNEMGNKEFAYSYVHVVDPDLNGHRYDGGMSAEYRQGVAVAAWHVGEILDLISTTPSLRDDTAIILTSDHGFSDSGNHADRDDPLVYTIPFCAWGPSVEAGGDLYQINGDVVGGVKDPQRRKGRGERVVRNTYSGILAADWLGIHPRTGAFADQYLSVGNGGTTRPVVRWPAWFAANERRYAAWYGLLEEEEEDEQQPVEVNSEDEDSNEVDVVVPVEEISKGDDETSPDDGPLNVDPSAPGDKGNTVEDEEDGELAPSSNDLAGGPKNESDQKDEDISDEESIGTDTKESNTISAAELLGGEYKDDASSYDSVSQLSQEQDLSGVEIGLISASVLAVVAVVVAAYVYITTARARNGESLPPEPKRKRTNLDETRVSFSSDSDTSQEGRAVSPTTSLFSGYPSSSVEDTLPVEVARKSSMKRNRSFSMQEAAGGHIMAVEAGCFPDDVVPFGSIEVTVAQTKAKWHIIDV
mmetsp:Transcript_17158/g.37215  ORF Transcript_17158/g.37215 Transcript_17158/m.37215 type:complete len:634 (+) Transcript_17158:245-2146(+)|eukprot:CAMPEP_0178552986 /NCGR_PEP_ID=MMETSP0697-20121206/7582_1 /TAXON_ID=265572 /ORGANISM="Extubocellulus spinifer, Strain CCMP396" /LENGTH=633 /DNA_ID=CAMNT_0020185885 /DNA_START=271 /DNA_END=2172 /DNA_ORIENTATION=+